MAKGWTVVILIMILDVDVTAEGGIIQLIAPKRETTHSILCIASLRGPPIGGQDRDGVSYRCSALYTLCLFEAFPLKGKREVWEEKQRVIYFMYHSAVSPFGGERSEPVSRMLIMPYDIESQFRNADFILIALRAIPQPLARRAVKLTNPPAVRPVHLKNPFPQPFSTTRRRQAATTLGAQPRQPSRRRRVQKQLL